MRVTARTLILFLLLAMVGWACPAPAAQPGTLAIGVHVTLVYRWLDPGEAEALITPYMVLYTLHDALVKPMPGNLYAPSLAESWTLSKDGSPTSSSSARNAKFHNGDPVTADDVKFSLRPLQGQRRPSSSRRRSRRSQVLAPNRVRFVLKEPWPDFMAFYGTSATGAGWIVPKKYIEKVGEDGLQEGSGRRRTVQVRRVQPRHRAGARRIPRATGARRRRSSGS